MIISVRLVGDLLRSLSDFENQGVLFDTCIDDLTYNSFRNAAESYNLSVVVGITQCSFSPLDIAPLVIKKSELKNKLN